MANNQTIKIGVEINSNSAKETTQAERLGAALKDAASTAQKIKIPAGGGSGATGVQQVMQKSVPVGAQAVMQYGQQRGTAGATGAEARDFAAQSQGLGGLVRLYATYAANIYAVSEAFRALSNAMDTTNMVRGLDQLGAATGTALGTLSKRLVDVTDGAISMREAMTAVAQSNASGMSSQNILRMGEVAKKASQALGVNMSDAISRLSRGINKLEPELLDELGIFIKLDDVTTKYALSVGKTVSSLTDFERRQAVANAVLDQGQKKFGALEIDSNPYLKLAATAKDLTQTLLELVNTVLTPLVSILASSPTALLGVFGAIGLTLTKQAIPALADFKAGLAKTADVSRQAASSRFQELKSSLNNELKVKLKAADDAAEAEIEKMNVAQARIAAIREAGPTKITKRAFEISEKIPGKEGNITQKDLDYLDGLIAKNTKLTPIYKDLRDSIEGYNKAEKTAGDLERDNNVTLEKKNSMFTAAGQAEMRYYSEVNKARNSSLVSQSAQIGATQGLGAALSSAISNFKTAGTSITTTIDLLDEAGNKTGKTLTTTTAGVGLFSRSLVLARSAIAGTAAAIGAAVSAFAPWLQLIGLIVAAGGAFISWMSNTKDESEATSKALTGVKDGLKNLNDTIEVINKKPVLEQFDSKSVAARATAINNLTTEMSKLADTSFKELAKMGSVDEAVNWVSKLWNGDVESKLQKNISNGLTSVFKSIDSSSPAGKAAGESIRNVLGVNEKFDLTSVDKVNQVLDRMTSSQRKQALSDIAKEMEKFGISSAASASKITEVDESFKKVSDARQKFQQQFIATDAFTQYGQSLIDSFFKVDTALQDTEQNLGAIITLANQVGALAIPDTLKDSLRQAADQARNLQLVRKELTELDNDIKSLESKKSGLEAQKAQAESRRSGSIDLPELKEVNEQLDRLKANRNLKADVEVNLSTTIKSQAETVAKGNLEVFKTGADIVASKLSTEFVKAGATVTNAIAGVYAGTETGARLRAQAEQSMLKAQAAQIAAQKASLLATEANTIATMEDTLSRERIERIRKDKTENPELETPAEAKQKEEIGKRKAGLTQLRGEKTPSFAQAANTFAAEMASTGTSSMSRGTLDLIQQLEGLNAAMAGVNAQSKAVSINLTKELTAIKFEETSKKLSAELSTLKAREESITAVKQLNSETNSAAALARQQFESEKEALAFRIERLAIEAKIAQYKAQGRKDDPELRKEETKLDKLGDQQKIVTANRLLKDQVENINIATKQKLKLDQDDYINKTRALETQQLDLALNEKTLDINKNKGLLTERDYIIQKDTLSNAQARLAYERNIGEARNTQNIALTDLKRREDEIEAARKSRINLGVVQPGVERTEQELQAQKEITEERNRLNATYTSTTQNTERVLTDTLTISAAQKELALEQEAFNTRLTETTSIAESLAGAFGSVGEKIGQAIVGLLEMQRTQELNNRSIEYYTKQVSEADKRLKQAKESATEGDDAGAAAAAVTQATKDRTEAQKGLDTANKKSQRDEMTYYAKSVGFAKSLFKEKTGAYKALAAVEKGMHLMRMADTIKEFAVKTGLISAETAATISGEVSKTGAAAGGFLARAGTYVSEIFAKFVAAMGPWGFAAAAAAVAALGLAQGKKSYSFTPTQAQKVEVQGTGQDYVMSGTDSNIRNGEKRRVSGGVFGDDTAKADSIRSSLEIIKENSTDSLLYDNKALTALEKMVTAIDKTAAGLYRIPGLAISEDEAKTNERIGFTALIGGEMNSEILGSTIKLSGSLDDLADNAAANAQRLDKVRYEDKIRILGMGFTYNSGTKDVKNQLPQEVTDYLGDIFKSGRDALKAVGEQIGKTVDTSKLIATESLNLKPGMTGEEFTTELTAVTSKQFNIWAEKYVFPEFEKFNEFGEEYLETVLRVSTANASMRESLESLLPGVEQLGNLTLEASETLIENFGNTQEAISAFRNYSESMFTDEERLDKKRTTVGKVLYNLGLQDIKTKAQYNAKVQQLVRDGQQNTETFEKLIRLAPQFAEAVDGVAQRLEDAQSAVESAYKDLDSVGDVFRNIIKSLTDLKDSLNKTITTPGEQYIKAKARFEQLALEAKTSPKAAQELAGAGQVFAEASRTMFASSDAYVEDVGFINRAVDEVLAINQNLLTPIEEQLSVAREQNERLKEISGYTYETEFRIRDLIIALQAKIPEVAAAKVATAEPLAPPAKLNIVEKPVGGTTSSDPMSYSAITSSYYAETLGKGGSRATLRDLTSNGVAIDLSSLGATAIDPQYASLFRGAGRASGSNYIPKDQITLIHEGERIIPAADNRQLMQMMSQYSNGGNTDLYNEVCRLTKQVEVLTQTVADGAILNATATDRNTEQIATTIQSASDSTVYNTKLQSKVAVV
jgi:hypothetical protein